MTEPDTSETTSFEVTATRKFEVDFSDEQVERMIQQTGGDNPEDAVSEALFEQEVQSIAPQQKLLGIDVQVNGPSDD